MKTMTCKQLGGACDKTFSANSFEEIANLSKKHGLEMSEKKDVAHIQAMNAMMEKIKTQAAMNEWMESKRKEFDSLPDDK